MFFSHSGELPAAVVMGLADTVITIGLDDTLHWAEAIFPTSAADNL
ncbi:MAG: hypothetical protein WDO16_15495 [Bacteroidota bacterium]